MELADLDQERYLRRLTSDAIRAVRIEIHGHASVEGPSDEYNYSLACKRAARIQDVFEAAGVSAPIRLFSHGPTTAFGEARFNRNVTLVLTLPAQRSEETGVCIPEVQAGAAELRAANATLAKSRSVADTILRPGARSDLAYWFAELYYYITRYEIEDRGLFDHPAFVLHFIPIFYDMYAVNAEQFARGELANIVANWGEHFATAEAIVDPSMLVPYAMAATRSLISGVKAHIQGDMADALVWAYRSYAARYCRVPPFHPTYHPDFFDHNRPIFDRVRTALINELLNRGMGLQMPGRRGMDPNLAARIADVLRVGMDVDKIYRWRQTAWDKAKARV